jgi:hypothetical protein
MNNQEAFNNAWQRFAVNKEPASYDPVKNMCMYRGPNGTKCAIGGLYPDDQHHTENECASASTILRGEVFSRWDNDGGINREIQAIMPEALEGLDPDFADDLQGAHDIAARKADFHKSIRKELYHVAEIYRLDIPTD